MNNTKKTKTRQGIMGDRYEHNGRCMLRVRCGNGPTVEVRVRDEDRESAGKQYGGHIVSYCYRGGRAFYLP